MPGSFLTVSLKYEQLNSTYKDSTHIRFDDHQILSEAEMDSIIGRSYKTRGLKRSYVEDPISIEPDRNSYRKNREKQYKRELLHLKDTYHLTDCAFNAIVNFVQSKKKLFSLSEIERLN